MNELPLEFSPIERPIIRENTIFHVGISGGKDSVGALIWLVHESGIPKEKIAASFVNISNDHKDTLAHVDLISRTVHPIETIYPPLGFFDLARKKNRFPSTKARFCTEELKIIPTQRHITKLFAKGFSVISVSGVRADESEERAGLPEWDYSGSLLCLQWRPLIRWTLKDVLAIHTKYGVPLNPLYAKGARRVGCWPCFMCQKREVRLISQHDPDRIDEIDSQEQWFEKNRGRFSSFFAADKVPIRFRSKTFVAEDGSVHKVGSIRDVVAWSLTGKRAKGSYLDEPEEKDHTCHSGFCE